LNRYLFLEFHPLSDQKIIDAKALISKIYLAGCLGAITDRHAFARRTSTTHLLN